MHKLSGGSRHFWKRGQEGLKGQKSRPPWAKVGRGYWGEAASPTPPANGERCNLPQWGLGRSPGNQRFSAISAARMLFLNTMHQKMFLQCQNNLNILIVCVLILTICVTQEGLVWVSCTQPPPFPGSTTALTTNMHRRQISCKYYTNIHTLQVVEVLASITVPCSTIDNDVPVSLILFKTFSTTATCTRHFSPLLGHGWITTYCVNS